MNWADFLELAAVLAIPLGCAWLIRHEGRAPRASIPFWPVKHFSRERQPILFTMRQITGSLFVAVFGARALSCFAHFSRTPS